MKISNMRVPLPLTLTLSLREREQQVQLCPSAGAPLTNPVRCFAERLDPIPPLPKGEGRGEGKAMLRQAGVSNVNR